MPIEHRNIETGIEIEIKISIGESLQESQSKKIIQTSDSKVTNSTPKCLKPLSDTHALSFSVRMSYCSHVDSNLQSVWIVEHFGTFCARI